MAQLKNFETFEKRLGYSFINRDLLIRSLSHSSYVYENSVEDREDNEVMEFLGDSVLGLIITPLWILADAYLTVGQGLSPMIRQGVIPFAAVMVILMCFYLTVKKGFSTRNNEAVQAVFVLILVGFVVFTVTGLWFRGPGMKLVWP